MKELYVMENNKVIDYKALGEKEEIIINKKKKELTAQQRKLLAEKDKLKVHCNQLGGFVHMFYVNNKLLFNDLNIDRANISRLIYLATYMDYNNRQENLLVRRGKGNKVEPILGKINLQRILKLSDSTFKRFMKDVKENNLLWEVDNKFYISNKYFTKGKSDFKNKEYTRIFINTTRFIYDNCNVSQHKTLSYVYQLIPYMNYELNIICKNPLEIDYYKLDKLGLKDICQLLGIGTSNESMRRFKRSLRKFYVKVNGVKYHLFSYTIVNDKVDYYVVNPLVVWGGKDTSKIRDIILTCYFM